MRYRVLQILCLIVGVLPGLSLFVPGAGDSSGPGYSSGFILGKLFMLALTLGCFVAAFRLGKLARAKALKPTDLQDTDGRGV